MRVFAGGGEDRERPHQPESGRAGWLRRPVQNQETHAAEQADEGVLREAGACSPAEGQAVRVCAVRVSCVCAWVCAVRVHVLCARGCVQRVHHMCVPCVCACAWSSSGAVIRCPCRSPPSALPRAHLSHRLPFLRSLAGPPDAAGVTFSCRAVSAHAVLPQPEHVCVHAALLTAVCRKCLIPSLC